MENLVLESISEKLTSLDASFKKLSDGLGETRALLRDFRSVLTTIESEIKRNNSGIHALYTLPENQPAIKVAPARASFSTKAFFPMLLCLITSVLLACILSAGLTATLSNGQIDPKILESEKIQSFLQNDSTRNQLKPIKQKGRKRTPRLQNSGKMHGKE